MQGKVAMINHRRGWISVLTANNDFTIIEVLEHSLPELGNTMSGNLQRLGGQSLRNETQEHDIDVYIQEIYESGK